MKQGLWGPFGGCSESDWGEREGGEERRKLQNEGREFTKQRRKQKAFLAAGSLAPIL